MYLVKLIFANSHSFAYQTTDPNVILFFPSSPPNTEKPEFMAISSKLKATLSTSDDFNLDSVKAFSIALIGRPDWFLTPVNLSSLMQERIFPSFKRAAVAQ